LDFLKGESEEPHEEEIVFANVILKNHPRKIKKEKDVDEGIEVGAIKQEAI